MVGSLGEGGVCIRVCARVPTQTEFNHFLFTSAYMTHQMKAGWCVGLHSTEASFHHVGISTKYEGKKKVQAAKNRNAVQQTPPNPGPTPRHPRCNDSTAPILQLQTQACQSRSVFPTQFKLNPKHTAQTCTRQNKMQQVNKVYIYYAPA